jgi:hypothetical protein
MNSHFIRALSAFKQAANELSKEWDQYEGPLTFAEHYPFSKSFDELALQISEWCDDAVNQLTQKPS